MKKLVYAVLGIILFCVIALLALPLIVSEDMLKNAVVQKVESATGKKLTVEGEFKLKFFPSVGVYMEKATLSEGTSGKLPVAILKSLNVDVETIPLFSGNVNIQSLELDNPHIILRVDAAGGSNWENKQTADSSATAPANQKSNMALPLQSLQLSEMKIINGTVDYENRQNGGRWQINGLDLTASLDGLDKPLKAEGSVGWNGRPVKFSLLATTPMTLINKQKTGIEFDAKSDYLTIAAKGDSNGSGYNGSLVVDSSSIGDLMVWLSPETKKSPLPRTMSLAFKSATDCTTIKCTFSSLSLRVDNINANGDLMVKFNEEIPYVEANLSTEQIDFTPFLPQDMQQSSGRIIPSAHAQTAWSKEPIDLSGLKAINGAFTLKAGRMLIQKIHMENTTLHTKLQNGRAMFDMPGFGFYDGTASVTAQVDVTGRQPHIQRGVTIKGMNLGAFLIDAIGKDRFTGTADLQVNASTRGNSVHDFISALQGSGNAVVTNGSIKGYDIAGMVRNIQSAFKEVDTGEKKTDFAELSGSFTINQGIFVNNDLAMKAPLFRLTGAGQVNLPLQTVNYRLNPQFIDTLKGQGSGNMEGIGVPVIVSGTFDNLVFRPDVQGIVKDVMQNPEAYKEKAKEVRETIKDLRGMFKKPKPIQAPAEPAAPAAPTAPTEALAPPAPTAAEPPADPAP